MGWVEHSGTGGMGRGSRWILRRKGERAIIYTTQPINDYVIAIS